MEQIYSQGIDPKEPPSICTLKLELLNSDYSMLEPREKILSDMWWLTHKKSCKKITCFCFLLELKKKELQEKIEMSKKMIFHQEKCRNMIKHYTFKPKTLEELEKEKIRKRRQVSNGKVLNIKRERKKLKD